MRLRFSNAVLLVAALGGPALAQSPLPTPPSTVATPSVLVTLDQEEKIRDVAADQRAAIPPVRDFVLATGVELPPSVDIHPLPEDVGIPHYQFAVVGRDTVLVDPSTRRIVKVIE
ncbi:DUF1236 domain-containing protein [Aquabacter sp. L1I39]|uniref:DUF1236 domain-containing protein n=1 Tax=Aquabacter sp. L1I39 TaxID=2820278 RepID=UPI001AD9F6E4|nr:DUF1236 domain-containing protein [Aquabacter sp. L1I39]QTL05550.1 DUF1236 domain-containing protein [Aquabacter sp. L1I39]